MNRAALVSALLVLATACGGSGGSGGGGGGGADRGRVPLEVELPAQLTGRLEISVEEGPVGDDDLSEINFGSIEIDAGFVLIEIAADVVRRSGLTRDELVAGGSYRVHLDQRSAFTDPLAPSYVVTSIERSG